MSQLLTWPFTKAPVTLCQRNPRLSLNYIREQGNVLETQFVLLSEGVMMLYMQVYFIYHLLTVSHNFIFKTHVVDGWVSYSVVKNAR